MRIQPIAYTLCVALLVSFSACNNPAEDRAAGGIILGDSSLIVTETDSQYLQDLVMDVEPLTVEAEMPKPAETPVVTPEGTPAATENPAPAPEIAGGFKIDFGGFTATLTGIDGKEYMQQNPKTQAGVSYAVASGDLGRADMVIEGLRDIKVRQRHQSELSLRSGSGALVLKSMGKFTSEWKEITGRSEGNRVVYSLKSLQHPEYKKISASSLRSGVQKQANSDRLSRSALNKWLQEAKRVKGAGDPPSVVLLDNVQWQISGKDKSGKQVFKTLRFEP